MEITPLEIQVLKNIIKSEYMDVDSKKMINWAVWSFSATNEQKSLAGALGSLVKKGLCGCQDNNGESTCWLTEKGYELAKTKNLL